MYLFEETGMFKNGKQYDIPADLPTVVIQAGNDVLKSSIAELGIRTAIHFGTFAGTPEDVEMFHGVDAGGRKISFTVDEIVAARRIIDRS